MIAIDTNGLIRVLVEDTKQPEQTQTARTLVENAKKVYLTQVVQVEFTWVLAKIYKIGKVDLIAALEHLLENPSFILQNSDIFSQALGLFKQGQADFADYLILAESQRVQAGLYSFDKCLGRQSEVTLLS